MHTRMRRSRLAPLLASAGLVGAAVGFLTLPASAEERKGSWELGLFVGNTFYAKEQQLANKGSQGLRTGWHSRPAYEVECQDLTTPTSSIPNGTSTLIDTPFVFFSPAPGVSTPPSFTSVSFSARFLIYPRNERR